MGYSAWKIWWRPRKAARVLESFDEMAAEADSLRCENEKLKAEIDGLLMGQSRVEGELSELRIENTELSETNQALNNGNARLGERLATVENELKAAQEELAQRADTESQIRQFDEFIGRVEQMKETYEHRILSLRAMVKALKSSSGEDDGGGADELAVIDMDRSYPPEKKEKKSSNPEDTETDWLEDLPD